MFTLTDKQHSLIDQACANLSPDNRHSLLLRIGTVLQLSGVHIPTDALVEKAIARALSEIGVAP
jgi:hypothetical protein